MSAASVAASGRHPAVVSGLQRCRADQNGAYGRWPPLPAAVGGWDAVGVERSAISASPRPRAYSRGGRALPDAARQRVRASVPAPNPQQMPVCDCHAREVSSRRGMPAHRTRVSQFRQKATGPPKPAVAGIERACQGPRTATRSAPALPGQVSSAPLMHQERTSSEDLPPTRDARTPLPRPRRLRLTALLTVAGVLKPTTGAASRVRLGGWAVGRPDQREGADQLVAVADAQAHEKDFPRPGNVPLPDPVAT
jgi:hypothetical protein